MVYVYCSTHCFSSTSVITSNHMFTTQHGESALHIAAGYGHLSVVKLLIKNGAKLDSKDKVLVFFIV